MTSDTLVCPRWYCRRNAMWADHVGCRAGCYYPELSQRALWSGTTFVRIWAELFVQIGGWVLVAGLLTESAAATTIGSGLLIPALACSMLEMIYRPWITETWRWT